MAILAVIEALISIL